MGMTIDDAKEWLKLAVPIKALTQEEFETFIQAVNLAVDTMCKYQRIIEIVNSNPDYIHHTDMDAYKLNSIREVIEDGNNSD